MSSGDAFVGRAGELAVLDQELARARTGEPRLVWLTGEAGIGKTTLLRRFSRRLPGAQLLWASGDEDEVDLPYGVLGQLLTSLPAGAKALRSLAAELSPESDPLAVGAALLSGFGELQAAGPIVLVVDDAHWADERSVQALVFVLRRLRSDQILVLLSARLDPAPGSAEAWERALAQRQLTRRLPLGGLSAEDLRRLSPELDGVSMSPEASRRLHEHTGGHPLYARALLEELPPGALLETSGVLPAPHSLASLVLVRLAKLSPAAQTFVLAAAILGSRGGLSDVVMVADVPDPVVALDEAVRAGLLIEAPPGHPRDVAFPHQLVRSAIYADLAPARRHDLHRRAANVLGGLPSLVHRVAAAVGPDEGLAQELEGLSRTEREQQNWRSAADHLLAAADLSTNAEEKGRRLVDAVAAMLAGGDIARAIRFEASVLATPASAGRHRVLGQLAVLSGRFARGREELSAALALERNQSRHQAIIGAYLGLVGLVEGDAVRAVELATEALEADLGSESDADAAPVAGFVLLLGLAVQGRQEEATQLLDLLDADAGSGAERTAQRAGLRAVLALWSDREREAAAALTEVLRASPPGLLMQGRVMLLTALAEALYRVGDWDGAATNAELATSLAQDAGILLGYGITHAVSSYLSAGRGQWDEAETRLAVARQASAALPWWASRAYTATAAATVAQARGDCAGMRAALRAFDDAEVLGPVDGIGSLAWRLLLVEALLGSGELDQAEADLRAVEERTGGRLPGWSALEAARLRASLIEARGAPDQTRRAYQSAMRLSENVQAEFSRARLETAYGRFLLDSGERRPALDLLRSAHARLQRLDAKPYLAVCDNLLHTAGLRPPSAGDALGFTVQELAVARLVAAGRTNSEAGLELFITSRTVAFHLTNIYAKAGINSRRELAERLPQLLS